MVGGFGVILAPAYAYVMKWFIVGGGVCVVIGIGIILGVIVYMLRNGKNAKGKEH